MATGLNVNSMREMAGSPVVCSNFSNDTKFMGDAIHMMKNLGSHIANLGQSCAAPAAGVQPT
jgi:hypothetical protein